MIKKIRLKLKNIELVLIVYDKLRHLYFRYLISDKRLIKKQFKKRLGREVNLENPTKYNDKLQWLKLNWYDPKATLCADKYEVRKIVNDTIGEEYLNELIAVYDSVEEIDVDKLPNQFVLKGTHGSGFNIICKDKTTMDWKQQFKKMRRWMRLNYYYEKLEWVYKDIKPRIVCEKYLEDKVTRELRDYKFFCFDGEVKLIQVDFDRFDVHKRNFFDLDWNYLDVSIKYPNDSKTKIEKPEKLSKMIDLSKRLSEKFNHVRVDFYSHNNIVVFGELTFFHGSGMEKFYPDEFETIMGSWMKLPSKVSITKN